MRNKIFLICMQLCMLSSIGANPTSARAAEVPFIGEVRWFAGNFAPRGWAFCDGQLLQVSEYSALFSLLGTTYGGDGRNTFGLPDLRGSGMVHEGTGPGLTPRALGEKDGDENVVLNANQLPSHAHTLRASNSRGDSVLPDDRSIARVGRLRVYNGAPGTDMGATTIASAGGSQSHNNMQPSIALNCIIALTGVYPPR